MSLAALSWLRPWWLLALLPIGVLAWRVWRSSGGDATAWRQVIDAHLLPHLLVRASPRGRRVGLALYATGWLLAVLALAGPTLDNASANTYRRDAVRVLVVDLSAPGRAPSRIEQIKLKLLDLLRALPEGQTALVVYAGEPYLIVPPTTDVETIARFIPELAADALPVPGNRPERALLMAHGVLARSAAAVRDVVWVTAEGSGSAVPLAGPGGVHLTILHAATTDEPALTAAAQRTGGSLTRLSADDSDIRHIVAALQTGGWSADTGHLKSGADIGYWLALLLLPLAALAFRGGLLTLLAAPLLLASLLAPQPAEALELPAALRDWQAWRLLESGDAQAAAQRFNDPRWRAAASYRAGRYAQAARLLESQRDPDSLYNRGNALARQGLLAEALAAYEAALMLRAEDADILHNRDLVKSLLNPPESRGKEPDKSKPPRAQTKKPEPPTAPPDPGSSASTSRQNPKDEAEREAGRLAEQWLRGVPDEPGNLLRRKLLVEHQRRQAGKVAQPW